MGPEMFFRPEIVDSKWNKGITHHVDDTIQSSPIDTRRNLYQNIVLSGGSSQTVGFRERLQKELRTIVSDRSDYYFQTTGTKPTPVKVDITENPFQAHAVFHGASMMAQSVFFFWFQNIYRMLFRRHIIQGLIIQKKGPGQPDTILYLLKANLYFDFFVVLNKKPPTLINKKTKFENDSFSNRKILNMGDSKICGLLERFGEKLLKIIICNQNIRTKSLQ